MAVNSMLYEHDGARVIKGLFQIRPFGVPFFNGGGCKDRSKPSVIVARAPANRGFEVGPKLNPRNRNIILHQAQPVHDNTNDAFLPVRVLMFILWGFWWKIWA